MSPACCLRAKLECITCMSTMENSLHSKNARIDIGTARQSVRTRPCKTGWKRHRALRARVLKRNGQDPGEPISSQRTPQTEPGGHPGHQTSRVWTARCTVSGSPPRGRPGAGMRRGGAVIPRWCSDALALGGTCKHSPNLSCQPEQTSLPSRSHARRCVATPV